MSSPESSPESPGQPAAGFVTIVSGLPRSGTSMMMKMLEAGGIPVLIDRVRRADDDNPKGYYEFEPVKQTKDDTSWLEDAPGRAVKMVYSLLYDLPSDREYRVVFMRREMAEILASQKKMLARKGIGDGGVTDEQMAALFHSQLEKFNQWAAAQSHLKILEVSYNQMLRNAAPVLEQIASFLDGAVSTKRMAGVIDAGLYRNRA